MLDFHKVAPDPRRRAAALIPAERPVAASGTSGPRHRQLQPEGARFPAEIEQERGDGAASYVARRCGDDPVAIASFGRSGR